MGNKENIKITTVEDLPKAKNELRIGFGYDVHKLVEGRKLILCGVNIPYDKGLLGHSDADVATHALIDAMLGAAAMGDIGKCFPDTSEDYKDANSVNLLKEVNSMLKNKNYKIQQADITIIAQSPKLSPYINDMVNTLESALALPKGSINVKATTTEKLGFCGRGEGIAANAVCTIIGI
ncbi:MAG: 2-C-methyl-D-erythritol 2,4-cyclodiphosphate synthase [Christensenellaceae bacterium]|nr:2-C-methyl-D-erythritol 2,4-cyclodiphosphate synthase [Christensenellaceae bacterium]